MTYSSKKPYQDINMEDSYLKRQSKETRFIQEAISKESIFEKPYRQLDRPLMHQDPSVGNANLAWNFGNLGRTSSGFTFCIEAPFCQMSAQHNDDANTIVFRLLSAGLYYNFPDPSAAQLGSMELYKWKATDFRWQVTGNAVLGFKVLALEAHNGFGSPGIEVHYDPNAPASGAGLLEITAQVFWMAFCRGLETCKRTTWVRACVCPPAVSLVYSGASDTTIIRNGSASIVISGGSAPYTFEVAGTGHYWDSNFTKTKLLTRSTTVLLYADNSTSCGMADITVTDCCGNIVTGEVRNTSAGSWCNITYDEVTIPAGAAGVVNNFVYSGRTYIGGEIYTISGKYRFIQQCAWNSTDSGGPGDDCSTGACDSECSTAPCDTTRGCDTSHLTVSGTDQLEYVCENTTWLFGLGSYDATNCCCDGAATPCNCVCFHTKELQEWKCSC